MTTTPPPPWKARFAKWIPVGLLALLITWCAQPALTVALQVAEGSTQRPGAASVPLMTGGLALVFLSAVFGLQHQPTTETRIEAGSLWSGVLMWLTIPMLLLILWQEASADTSPDQGGATAAFFMLMIFGGYYAILGSVLLLVAFVMRRRRRAAQLQGHG